MTMTAILALVLVASSTTATVPPTRCNPERLPGSADKIARPTPPPGKAKLQLLAQVPGQERTWPASTYVRSTSVCMYLLLTSPRRLMRLGAK